MALAHSPQIVTRNLLLNLDFGNIQKCYNGSENLLTYSNDFSNAVWFGYCGNKTNVTYNTTEVADPNGTFTSIKIARNSVVTCNGGVGEAAWGVFWLGSTIVNTTDTYTASLYVRGAVAGDTVNFGFNDSQVATFTLSTSWQRITYTGVPNSTSRGIQIYVLGLNKNYYIWGAQLEKGLSASPYVQTVASTVTRPTTATSTISNYSHTINNSQYISYDGANNSIRFDRNETFASFTGSITSNVLTVTAMSGITTIVNGAALSYTGLTPTRVITSFGTGIGTVGTYNVSAGIDTTSRAMTAAYKIGGSATVTTVGILTSNTYLYNDHTTEVWARINDRNPAFYDVYEGESILVTFAGYHSMFLYYASGLRYYIWDNTGPTIKYPTELTLGTSGTDIIQGQWFQVAVTKSGTTFKTYLNGVLKKTDTITSTALAGVSDRLAIGSAYDNNAGSFNYYAKNNVGCLKMYNTTLTADEISQNFNALRGRYGI
jgi:hypothetical protein